MQKFAENLADFHRIGILYEMGEEENKISLGQLKKKMQIIFINHVFQSVFLLLLHNVLTSQMFWNY